MPHNAKILRLSQIRDGGPFHVRADYVMYVYAQSWFGKDDEWHDGTALMMLTGNSFTVADVPDVVAQMWLEALGE